jgi:hypothetical protein
LLFSETQKADAALICDPGGFRIDGELQARLKKNFNEKWRWAE